MLRRRHINADPRGRIMRFLLGVGDFVRWPFERVAWSIERRLLWPLRERSAGWAPAGRSVGAGALVAIAGAAVLAGVLLLPGDAPRERVAAPAPVAIAAPEPQSQAEAPQEPALQGAPPKFGVGEGVGVAQAAGDEGGATVAEAAGTEEGASAETAQPEAGAATTSSAEPVPAGPVAMKVARRFADAFVFYEIGERQARARSVFDETAAPQLATALSERPPRLPEGAKVPKARVVNLVPGPRVGRAYTVSVSLLRLGLTSELRLEMEKRKKGEWIVTDVRG